MYELTLQVKNCIHYTARHASLNASRDVNCRDENFIFKADIMPLLDGAVGDKVSMGCCSAIAGYDRLVTNPILYL